MLGSWGTETLVVALAEVTSERDIDRGVVDDAPAELFNLLRDETPRGEEWDIESTETAAVGAGDTDGEDGVGGGGSFVCHGNIKKVRSS